MSSHPRVRYRDVPGTSEILTPDFLDFLAGLDDAMRDQVAAVHRARGALAQCSAEQYATCVIAAQ